MFSAERDTASGLRDCQLHGHQQCTHPPPETEFSSFPSHRGAAGEIVAYEKIQRWNQAFLEGITSSCLLRQKVDLAYCRRDRLCLQAAGTEQRVLSEFSSFFSQSFSIIASQSVGLIGKTDIICLNLLILHMRKLGSRDME